MKKIKRKIASNERNSLEVYPFQDVIYGFFPCQERRGVMTSANVIRKLRLELKMSQLDLAKASGLTQTEISGIESGRIQIGMKRALKLAKALRVHPAIVLFSELYSKRAILSLVCLLLFVACGRPDFFGSQDQCKAAFDAFDAKAASIQENVTTTADMLKVLGTPWLTSDDVQYKYQVTADGYCGIYVIYAGDKVIKKLSIPVYQKFYKDGTFRQ
jgi:transcriptional regulator with XRE-family HTH domain